MKDPQPSTISASLQRSGKIFEAKSVAIPIGLVNIVTNPRSISGSILA